MSISVAVNPPKTPVTEGSGDKALATLPNVCKMPGPPAPFVPTPLPNVGASSDRLGDGTTSVTIEGSKVALKGSYFMSMPSGDVASQGTGGGVLSSCVQGKTEFTAPGSMNVKAEGKNIQLLGDAMTNNGSSKNTGATLPGNIQPALIAALGDEDAKALCEAMCAAKKDPKAVRKQDAVTKAMSSDKYPRWQAKDGSRMIPEVSYEIPSGPGKGALTLLRSAERVVESGQKAAASLFSGLQQAAALGKGNVVRWDFVQVINPDRAPTPGNVSKYVECKFEDELTPNQQRASNKMRDRDKLLIVRPEDCGC
ncbi:hypothetical protein tb265_17700 [Gemmatimonadetes bacterium T265]|nr:hypothetical protein tb265_17700 [Gemmatimonadetes bacterium T265]